jgi:hypothetical protein
VVLAAAYLFRDSIFSPSTPKAVSVAPSKLANGHGNPRDFIAKMKEGKKTSHHILWFANWYCRGICHPHCQRSQNQVRTHISRLRPRGIRL